MIEVYAETTITGPSEEGSVLTAAKTERKYFPIIDGVLEESLCADIKDVAYLLGLQIKYDGKNSQFTKMACRMLGIDSEWAK